MGTRRAFVPIGQPHSFRHYLYVHTYVVVVSNGAGMTRQAGGMEARETGQSCHESRPSFLGIVRQGEGNGSWWWCRGGSRESPRSASLLGHHRHGPPQAFLWPPARIFSYKPSSPVEGLGPLGNASGARMGHMAICKHPRKVPSPPDPEGWPDAIRSSFPERAGRKRKAPATLSPSG